MTRKKAEAEATREAATAPAPRDENGFELDGFGLPVSGPRRAAVLAEMDRADPNDDPEGWEAETPAPLETETVEVIGNGVFFPPVTDTEKTDG